jgi:hypothetical protein
MPKEKKTQQYGPRRNLELAMTKADYDRYVEEYGRTPFDSPDTFDHNISNTATGRRGH